jgi:hypothetical protein
MSRTRWIERGVVALLIAVVGWQQMHITRQERAVQRLYVHVNELVDAQKMLHEALKQRPAAALRTPMPHEVFARPKQAAQRSLDGEASVDALPQAQAMRAGKRRFNNQRKSLDRAQEHLPEASGATVLNRLYDAADVMAANENWDDATYNDVADVFEQTTTDMVDLWEDFRGGEVAPLDARDEVIALRDQAQDNLANILGEEGLEVLRQHVKAKAGNER